MPEARLNPLRLNSQDCSSLDVSKTSPTRVLRGLRVLQMTESYACVTCGKTHKDLPRSFAAEFPDMFANMDRDQRDARAVIGSDQCIIDQTWFFIRGCLEIPVLGSEEPFLWGLWASVREEVFDEIENSWESERRETRGPFKGRLANSLAEYPPTLNLKIKLLLQPVGTRPLFIVEKTDHPLAIEQASGITPGRAMELAGMALHAQPGGFPKPSP